MSSKKKDIRSDAVGLLHQGKGRRKKGPNTSQKEKKNSAAKDALGKKRYRKLKKKGEKD